MTFSLRTVFLVIAALSILLGGLAAFGRLVHDYRRENVPAAPKLPWIVEIFVRD
ncbi:MAG TPA: hypothetical protein VGZ26_12085 [Pirellulales bacterium]|jgi:hypothetical protein|nr:hypothetical protein [Pirellulales bacterium]